MRFRMLRLLSQRVDNIDFTHVMCKGVKKALNSGKSLVNHFKKEEFLECVEILSTKIIIEYQGVKFNYMESTFPDITLELCRKKLREKGKVRKRKDRKRRKKKSVTSAVNSKIPPNKSVQIEMIRESTFGKTAEKQKEVEPVYTDRSVKTKNSECPNCIRMQTLADENKDLKGQLETSLKEKEDALVKNENTKGVIAEKERIITRITSEKVSCKNNAKRIAGEKERLNEELTIQRANNITITKQLKTALKEKEDILVEKENSIRATKEKERVISRITAETHKRESQMELLLFERSLVGKSSSYYTVIDSIGGNGVRKNHHGSMSAVYHVKIRGKDLAMKIMLNLKENATSATIGREMIVPEFISRVPFHPNLLRIHHSFVGTVKREKLLNWKFDPDLVKDKTAFFLMPLCDGNLKDKILNNGVPVFKKREKFFDFLHGVVSGLNELKRYNFIHRDIKPENLLFKDGRFLVCDFGKCLDCVHLTDFKLPYVKTTNVDRGGTPKYQPSEIRDNMNCGSNQFLCFDKYDVYSLGLTCYELFSTKDIRLGLDLTEKECSHKDIRMIIKKMKAHYNERYSVEELLEVAERQLYNL